MGNTDKDSSEAPVRSKKRLPPHLIETRTNFSDSNLNLFPNKHISEEEKSLKYQSMKIQSVFTDKTIGQMRFHFSQVLILILPEMDHQTCTLTVPSS